MQWKDFISEAEKTELERAEKARDAAQEVLYAIRRRIQSRCEWRMRKAMREAEKKTDDR